MNKSYSTQNDLPQGLRTDIIRLLNGLLPDGINLSLQAKLAHWNVKGPHFLQLHDLFEKVYTAASTWVDLVAERAVQLGGVADGSLRYVAERTSLEPYSLEISLGRDHVKAISRSLSKFGRSVRAALEASDRASDAATSDVLVEIARSADKILWMVEAHLQSDA